MPSENGEHMNIEAPQPSVLDRKIDRRTFLKGATALGLAATTGSLFPKNEASAENTSNLAPVLMGFKEMSVEEQSEAVRRNIEIFKELPSENLVAVGESAKVYAKYPPLGDIPGPVFDFTGQEVVDASYFIAKENNPTEYLPNLSLISYPTIIKEGDNFGYTFDMQGIYLGRTQHAVDTSIGNINAHVIYVGMYAGEPNAENKQSRFVMPLWIGWEAENELSSWTPSVTVGSIDGPHRATPTPDAPPTDMSTALEALDNNLGNAVLQMQLNSATVPSSNLEEQAKGYGFPVDFFTVDAMRLRSESLKQNYEDLSKLTLREAKQDGYSLYSVGAESSPIPTAINDELLGTETYNEIIKNMPLPSQFLNKTSIRTDYLNRTPMAQVLNFYPTSSSIFG